MGVGVGVYWGSWMLVPKGFHCSTSGEHFWMLWCSTGLLFLFLHSCEQDFDPAPGRRIAVVLLCEGALGSCLCLALNIHLSPWQRRDRCYLCYPRTEARSK